jgi:ZIP family zinc transporter
MLFFLLDQIVRKPDESMLAFLLGTAVGVMFVLSVGEMWIHNAMEHGWLGITTAMLCGALLYQAISPFLPDFETPVTAAGEQFFNTPGDIGTKEAGKTSGSTSSAAFKPGTGIITRRGEAAAALMRMASDELDSPNGNGKLSSLTSHIEYDAVTAADGEKNNDTNDTSIDRNKEEIASATSAKDAKATRRSSELLRLGFLMAITMTLHNAPEGFAVAFSSFTDFGPIMAFAIAVHNIPEGYIISLPLYLSTGSRWKALGIATLSGLSEPAGAFVALMLGRYYPLMTEERIHYVLAFVGGIMAAVSCLELWPEGRKCRQDEKLKWGILVGGVVMGWTLWIGI